MTNIGDIINLRGQKVRIIGSSSSPSYRRTKIFLECETVASESRRDTLLQLIAEEGESRRNAYRFEVEKVIYNYPATIVLWKDGTKTVVKCSDKDHYDYQTGFLMCLAKKAYGNTGRFNDVIRDHVPQNPIARAARNLIESLNSMFDAF